MSEQAKVNNAMKAVRHMLDQIQQRPDLMYYLAHTEAHSLLCQAEAEGLGIGDWREVEEVRLRDSQPSYRRRAPDALRLKWENEFYEMEIGKLTSNYGEMTERLHDHVNMKTGEYFNH